MKKMKRVFFMVFIFILYLVINSFVLPKHLLTPAYLCGNSNYPTNKYHTFILSGYPSSLERGDFVMVEVNYNGEVHSIYKRVIGLPGERIEMKDGIIYIDGAPYNEKYIDYEEKPSYIKGDSDWDFTFEFIMNRSDLEGDTIPEGYYLILGDNRTRSVDSRFYGLVSKNQIKGKKVLKLGEIEDDRDSVIGKNTRKAVKLYEEFFEKINL